ncbi:HDOD domain-containing protein [Desulfoplanes formicivorans]|uniref:Histidine kinase n=1 Tax=Desulfoplanes formicivorans TaxID=1592317 RepID=A0A194AGJ3_9BACT|nr:HDOD domain-containing protein [Desulfoplanes formicivorans]GAU08330.1 histidine kinase [Desulfoplanes formicivorans]
MTESQKFQILFVDDEKNVLDGLRRPLRSMRKQWDMHFATSGRQGLAILAQQEMDLVVSDMYMPEMDGAAFLRQVMEHYPNTIRTILSGHSDKSLILKTLKPAHKFLHKPCSPETLIAWVKDILFFRQILPSRELREQLNGIGALPGQPLFFALLFEAIAHDDPQEVGEILPYDVNMAANLLKVTLNTFFTKTQGLPSLSDSAKLIGMDLLYEIVSSKDIFAAYNEMPYSGFSIDNLWRHCLRTARYAAIIAALESADSSFVNKCYLAGLLHDIGKYLLITTYPGDYASVLKHAPSQEQPLWALERAALGACHGMVGAYLMGIWGLPKEIVEAIAFHERPSAIKRWEVSPLCIVHVANVLDHLFLRMGKNDPLGQLDVTFLQQTISKEKLQRWQKACKKFFSQAASELTLLHW